MGQIDALLSVTDLVMLDIKHMEPEAHRKLTGHSNENILDFARYLDAMRKPVGEVKFDNLGIDYVLKDTPQLTKQQAKEAERIIRAGMENISKCFNLRT